MGFVIAFRTESNLGGSSLQGTCYWLHGYMYLYLGVGINAYTRLYVV